MKTSELIAALEEFRGKLGEHPFIMQGCSQLYRDGHYAQAVEEAAKAVFQYVRDVTGLAGDGASLVQAALSLKKASSGIQ